MVSSGRRRSTFVRHIDDPSPHCRGVADRKGKQPEKRNIDERASLRNATPTEGVSDVPDPQGIARPLGPERENLMKGDGESGRDHANRVTNTDTSASESGSRQDR